MLARPGFRLVGVMTYEGQVAGVPDAVPTQRARSAVVRRMKSASVRRLDERRHEVAAALAPLVDLEFWNSRGGLIASGVIGADRAPLPWAPTGLELTGMEGAGEVQTLLTGPGTDALRIGDLVWLRHAKAGEPAEHVRQVHLVQGDAVVDTVPTYRGLGQAW